jgi:hypothetical protein
VWVLVKGKKTAEGEELGNAWWDLVVNNESQHLGKDVEAALVVGLIGRRETVGLKRVCKITKRTVGCAWLEGA